MCILRENAEIHVPRGDVKIRVLQLKGANYNEI